MPKRTIWEVFLLAVGVSYVGVVLCGNVQSRGFEVAFLALAAQVLASGHRKKDR
jgi:hypothetical protein